MKEKIRLRKFKLGNNKLSLRQTFSLKQYIIKFFVWLLVSTDYI